MEDQIFTSSDIANMIASLARLEAHSETTKSDVKELSVYVMGNGTPEAGLNHRMARIESCMTDTQAHIKNKAIHGLGWWKHKYIYSVIGAFAVLLALWFVLYAVATANQALLLEIIKAFA